MTVPAYAIGISEPVIDCVWFDSLVSEPYQVSLAIGSPQLPLYVWQLHYHIRPVNSACDFPATQNTAFLLMQTTIYHKFCHG